jgi:hypothetical protein
MNFEQAAATVRNLANELQAELDEHAKQRRLAEVDANNYADLKEQIKQALAELQARKAAVAEAETKAAKMVADAEREAARVIGNAHNEATRILAAAKAKVAAASASLAA